MLVTVFCFTITAAHALASNRNKKFENNEFDSKITYLKEKKKRLRRTHWPITKTKKMRGRDWLWLWLSQCHDHPRIPDDTTDWRGAVGARTSKNRNPRPYHGEEAAVGAEI